MKVWITKFLFTKGIVECEALPWTSGQVASMCCVAAGREHGAMNGYVSFHERDWHASLAEAQNHAIGMVQRKRASLSRQYKALQATEVAFTSDKPKVWP